MGQLERYGLYVLCLVIVLILGVAIWGGDPAVVPPHGATQLSAGAAGAEGVSGPAPEQRPPATGAAIDGFFEPVQPDAAELGGLAGVQTSAPATAADTAGGNVTTPGPAPAPPSSAVALRTYVVKNGDNFEKVARDVLGSTKLVAEIRKLNPDVNERRLQIGTVLKLPTADSKKAAVEAAAPGAASKAGKAGWREYVVKKGDNPWTISKAVYDGDSRHAKAILDANGLDDPRKLREKIVLQIPPKPE